MLEIIKEAFYTQVTTIQQDIQIRLKNFSNCNTFWAIDKYSLYKNISKTISIRLSQSTISTQERLATHLSSIRLRLHPTYTTLQPLITSTQLARTAHGPSIRKHAQVQKKLSGVFRVTGWKGRDGPPDSSGRE
ncbi:hypothetical protein CEXT_476841 [Caerostris extrusa]|uniref:Uncharacterized protein n=1 Tax=Caerostris extrusa TaxID=172846 RepID=A0AAV4QXD3_CAEEX|nr:hypothetical protein CEXT_476841 [Caerostris extrusa]